MAHRPNILKLATKISLESLTYTGITYDDPEYKLLEPIVDDDMCTVMMHMRLEANRTAEEIAHRAKKDLAFTQQQLDKLKTAGVIRSRVVNGRLCWYYPIWVPGIMEGVLSNREQCDKYPVLGECFERYTRERVSMLAPFMDVVNNPDYPKDQIGKSYTLTVDIRGEKTVIPCKAEESLLWAMERAGIKAPAHCHSGECGWCHSHLAKGEVYIPVEADGRRLGDIKFNWIHPCVSFPLSDIELFVFPTAE